MTNFYIFDMYYKKHYAVFANFQDAKEYIDDIHNAYRCVCKYDDSGMQLMRVYLNKFAIDYDEKSDMHLYHNILVNILSK